MLHFCPQQTCSPGFGSSQSRRLGGGDGARKIYAEGQPQNLSCHQSQSICLRVFVRVCMYACQSVPVYACAGVSGCLFHACVQIHDTSICITQLIQTHTCNANDTHTYTHISVQFMISRGGLRWSRCVCVCMCVGMSVSACISLAHAISLTCNTQVCVLQCVLLCPELLYSSVHMCMFNVYIKECKHFPRLWHTEDEGLCIIHEYKPRLERDRKIVEKCYTSRP